MALISLGPSVSVGGSHRNSEGHRTRSIYVAWDKPGVEVPTWNERIMFRPICEDIVHEMAQNWHDGSWFLMHTYRILFDDSIEYVKQDNNEKK